MILLCIKIVVKSANRCIAKQLLTFNETSVNYQSGNKCPIKISLLLDIQHLTTISVKCLVIVCLIN